MISARTIAEVKERTDLVALIAEHVPSLKLRGRSFTGLCPFHAEKTPSFHVNRERAFYHCFGCKESGGAIDFMTYGNTAQGYAIRDFLVAHAKEFHVDHIIYRQQIWTPYNPTWRHMADRGSPTANHMDHVHVAVDNA